MCSSQMIHAVHDHRLPSPHCIRRRTLAFTAWQTMWSWTTISSPDPAVSLGCHTPSRQYMVHHLPRDGATSSGILVHGDTSVNDDSGREWSLLCFFLPEQMIVFYSQNMPGVLLVLQCICLLFAWCLAILRQLLKTLTQRMASQWKSNFRPSVGVLCAEIFSFRTMSYTWCDDDGLDQNYRNGARDDDAATLLCFRCNISCPTQPI